MGKMLGYKSFAPLAKYGRPVSLQPPENEEVFKQTNHADHSSMPLSQSG